LGNQPKIDNDDLPPERAAAQRKRELELLSLLGRGLKPADLLNRGLSSLLSPHELNTLRRVAQRDAPAEWSGRHITRLTVLKLVSREGDDVAITALGKERIAQGS
jgi:hypothetical protein